MIAAVKTFRLIEADWPEFGAAERPPAVTVAELEERLEALRGAMESAQLTHLVVYADREHFANMAYLTNFDPRFEEAVLIVSRASNPLIVVGNECEGYLGVSPLHAAGKLRAERFQPFSLLDQPRSSSRKIRDIFAGEGIGATSQVGCIGWKYFADSEHPDGAHAVDLPSYLVDTLRELASRDRVVNATALMMHPGYGLRARCAPSEIAYFEYTGVLASDGMQRMLFGLRPGMTDTELAALSHYNGEPLSCHMTLVTEANRNLGLSGPVGARIRKGSPLATNIAYRGSNVCRAGWVADSAPDLVPAARDYVEAFAGPYFEVMAEWFEMLRIGRPGGELSALIAEKLPFDRFGIFLNAGHLIHLDEWLSSPIYAGSDLPLHSGMAIQVDVIPSSPVYFSTRMEDGIVLADAQLRRSLQSQYPACYARCQKRRAFMIDVLGIEVAEEVLPLTNLPAIVPPFFLRPNQIFAVN
ncbi:MAG: M24 family metallopeptidase [Gammaproteobacteria bacterium]|nr:M24 family metallopeptidase [Gammaproteobacteria bacterium]